MNQLDTSKLMIPDVVSATKLAFFLDVPIRNIKQLLESGELPGRKIGRKWFVARQSFLAYLGSGFPPSQGMSIVKKDDVGPTP